MIEHSRPIDRVREERKMAAQGRARRRRLTRLAIGIFATASLLGLGLGVALSRAGGDGVKLPGLEDHWHAWYSIEIDGEKLPAFPPSEGDVHSHGDGMIHVHPHSPETAGRAASLHAFFTSVGAELTNDSLRLPDGRTFVQNGNGSGEPAEIRVLVNGDPITGWTSYIPQEGDQVEIVIVSR